MKRYVGMILAIIAVVAVATSIAMAAALVNSNNKTGNYTPQSRTLYMTIVPDAAGDKHDRFVPDHLTVGIGDNVTIVFRNLDTQAHGFAMADYGIDAKIPAGTADAQGNLKEAGTYTIHFVANKVGLFTFHCTVYCGEGHVEMQGNLVVLSKQDL